MYILDYFEGLSLTESSEIKKTIQDLFRQTCILKVKYDPVTLAPKDNTRYNICVKHRAFIEEYLDVLGCELLHDPQENIFILSGSGAITERLSVVATKLLLILKIIYKDKIMGEGLNATVTNMAEIRKYGYDTTLITGKLSSAEWEQILGSFKRHQIIELPCPVAALSDASPIYIYNSINVFLPTSKVNEMLQSCENN